MRKGKVIVMIKITANSAEEMHYLGERFGQLAKPGYFFALDGDLGAGKTTLSQGIAKGLGIEDLVSSPTFTIIHEYETGRLPLYHMDVYRLKHPEELYDLGYEEYFYGEGFTVVEWANIIEPLLPEEYLGIYIRVTAEGRVLELEPHGEEYERLIEELTGCDYTKYR